MQTIRQQKTTLIKILSGDGMFVLQHVQQAQLITWEEYCNLKDNLTNQNRNVFIINLLDKLMQKGDEQCHKFFELLQQDEMQQTFPPLEELLIPPAVRQVVPAQDVSDIPKVEEYKMSSNPRGVCVIINNIHFETNTVLNNRKGSETDVECLQEVFQWLGFVVEVRTDLTARKMKGLLMDVSQREHNGDCFVCCILSHDDEQGFYGTDGRIIDSSDILQPFGRTKCPSLADKPKVFFLHTGWNASKYPIPDSDFLLALATIQGFHSYRHTLKGSWFIQSLCKLLKTGCKRGEDILTVLTQVIVEVSTLTPHQSRSNMSFSQIPHIDFTLRKRLIFHVPDPNPPSC
ncbi:caspase-8-like [Hoplias malabaricus]|uniref:caspase-8-like n=1 Tax=Hoplias malabaricus TaxID=27720 RepID=UPI00346280C0